MGAARETCLPFFAWRFSVQHREILWIDVGDGNDISFQCCCFIYYFHDMFFQIHLFPGAFDVSHDFHTKMVP